MSSQNEKPIIFSGSMVQAILSGQKSQTRRVIKPQPSDDFFDCIKQYLVTGEEYWVFVRLNAERNKPLIVKCPYGQVGDRLWVRETWGAEGYGNRLPIERDSMEGRLVYGEDTGWQNRRPSIHMPRWASRILLEITEVRAERVTEISNEDARAEGCSIMVGSTGLGGIGIASERYTFQKLWDSLNAKRGYGWDTNCWVWVIGFKVMNQRIR